MLGYATPFSAVATPRPVLRSSPVTEGGSMLLRRTPYGGSTRLRRTNKPFQFCDNIKIFLELQ